MAEEGRERTRRRCGSNSLTKSSGIAKFRRQISGFSFRILIDLQSNLIFSASLELVVHRRRPWMKSIILSIIFTCLSRQGEVHGRFFSPVCRVTSQIVQLQRDATTGLYAVIPNDAVPPHRVLRVSYSTSSDGGLRHRVYDGLSDQQWSRGLAVNAANDPRRFLKKQSRMLEQSMTTNSTVVVLARYCQCLPHSRREGIREPVYCPLNTNYCGIPREDHSPNAPLHCLNLPRGRSFANTSMWVIITLLSTIMAWLCCSLSGRYAIHYIFSKIIPNYNELHGHYIQLRYPERARFLMQRNLFLQHYRLAQRGQDYDWREFQLDAHAVLALWNRNLPHTIETANAATDSTSPEAPTHFKLPTRFYHPPKGQSVLSSSVEASALFDDETDLLCVICHGPFEGGERVGDLRCQHTLHVDCLKTWILRRNTCPLCQVPIATPGYNAVPISNKQPDTTTVETEVVQSEDASVHHSDGQL